jgi:hypothetical protein
MVDKPAFWPHSRSNVVAASCVQLIETTKYCPYNVRLQSRYMIHLVLSKYQPAQDNSCYRHGRGHEKIDLIIV